MNTQKLLIAFADHIGHAKVLSACNKLVDNGLNGHYINKLVTANRDGGCEGHAGDCGTCRDGVWYPCTEEGDPNG